MQKIWHGIFWKVLSCACFAGINILVRYLSGGSPLTIATPLPIYTIMFFQNFIGAIVVVAWMWHGNVLRTKDFFTIRPWLNITRLLTATLGIGLWYLSVQYIPITEVVALSFISKIITILGAVFFLKEAFNIQRKFAVFLSLAGGYLITRLDQPILNITEFNWILLLPVLAAFVFSLDTLLTRRLLALNESPRNLTWYALAFTAPFCLLPAVHYGWSSPDLAHMPWLLLLGVLGALSHYTFNKAYAFTEITALMPFGISRLIFCAAFSYFAFYEIPKSLDMWVGIIIIASSTLILGINAEFIRKLRNQFQFNFEARNS